MLLEKLFHFYFKNLIKLYNKALSSDNPFSRSVIKDLDNKLESRKPIEAIKDDISELKVELIHIKNYLRKLEIREEIKEQEAAKQDAEDEQSFEKVEQSSWFWG